MTNEERKVIELALEALENSVDLVVEDAFNAEQLYGNYPTRQGKVGGLKVLAEQHKQAITAMKELLAKPEQDQDEVDIRSRLYQRIHELETQLAQPEQEYGVVAGVGKGVEIPAGVKYYYIEPKLPPQRQPLKYEEYSALAETYTIDYGLLDCVDNHLYKPLPKKEGT